MNSNPQKDEPPIWQHPTVAWPFLSSARRHRLLFGLPGRILSSELRNESPKRRVAVIYPHIESSISDYRRVFLLSFVVGRPSAVLGGPRRSSVVLGGTFHVTASNLRRRCVRDDLSGNESPSRRHSPTFAALLLLLLTQIHPQIQRYFAIRVLEPNGES